MTMKRLLDVIIFCSAIKGWAAGTWKRGSIDSFCRLLAAFGFGGLRRLKFWRPFWFGLSKWVKRWPLKTALLLLLYLSWPCLNRWFSVSSDKFSMASCLIITFFPMWFLFLFLDFFFFDLETRENPTSRCLSFLPGRCLAERSFSSNSSVSKGSISDRNIRKNGAKNPHFQFGIFLPVSAVATWMVWNRTLAGDLAWLDLVSFHHRRLASSRLNSSENSSSRPCRSGWSLTSRWPHRTCQ